MFNISVSLLRVLPTGLIKWLGSLQFRNRVFYSVVRTVVRVLSKNHTFTIGRGAGKGLRFSPGPSNVGYALGTTEPEVQEVIQSTVRPHWVVYDVGANVGFYAVIMARLVGPDGLVAAFDPVEDNIRILRNNAQLNDLDNIVLFSLALSDSDGESPFLMSEVSTWGSLKSVRNEITDFKDEVMVKTARMDTFVERDIIPSPDFIKIDVEGAEANVLRGASRIIMSKRPLMLIELHGTNTEVGRLLDEHGYVCRVVDPSSTLFGKPINIIGSAAWYAHILAVPEESLPRCQS